MLDFHYNFLKKKFDAELLFTDTDSLMKMFMQNFLGTSNCFTLAIFRKTLSFMILKMKWSLAKWKLLTKEFWSINRWIKIRNIFYALGWCKKSNTAKRVNIATEFNEFKNTLLNNRTVRHKTKIIQSKKHELGTYEINKISLLFWW